VSGVVVAFHGQQLFGMAHAQPESRMLSRRAACSAAEPHAQPQWRTFQTLGGGWVPAALWRVAHLVEIKVTFPTFG
jgi:hypothetical protein